MTERLAPRTTNRFFSQVADGRWIVKVTLADGTKYTTPAYYTLEMAAADAQCWEAFLVAAPVETPGEKYDRMKRDEAAGVDTPVEELREGDYVWHTYTMRAGYSVRTGKLLSPSRQVSEWVEVSGAWARDWERGVYGFRLVGFDFGEMRNKGETVKTHRDPKALKRANHEATRAVYAPFSKR